MGRVADIVKTHQAEIEALASLPDYEKLRAFADSHGLDNSSGFSNFKKQLMGIGIDYDDIKRRTPRPTLVGTGVLKDRRWTETLITRFLMPADKLVQNPNHRSGPPMRLFDIKRVEAIEATAAFQEAKTGALKRSDAGLKAADTKRKQLMAKVEAMRITVHKLDSRQVMARAIKEYNAFKGDIAMERGNFDWTPASTDSDPAFLERIQINCIRHSLTEYDRALEEVAGKTGVTEAVSRIRERVFDAIELAYPQFRAECGRQR